MARALGQWIEHGGAPDADALLFYARPPLLSEEVFSLLRRRWSCPLLGLNLDDKTNFHPYGLFSDRNDGYVQWAPKFDVNFYAINKADMSIWATAITCRVNAAPG